MTDQDWRLDVAVERGLISAAQAAAIRAIEDRADAGKEAPVEGGFITALLGPRRGFTAATIAYSLGALTVLVAMAWFLSDRWAQLGPGGVLGVVAVYATLFTLTARVLRREGFTTAAGLATLLLVALAPVAALALQDLLGLFPDSWRLGGRGCSYPDYVFWNCRGREFVAELATMLAALVALRRVRFAMLVAPIVAIAVRMLFHLGDAMSRAGLGQASSGWLWAIGASLLTAAAYQVDREQHGDEDFAFWVHLGAALSAVAAAVMLTSAYPGYRHLLVPGAFVAFALALTLRRRPWAVLGTGLFGWYVTWLAAEVFEDSPAFPIVLAAIGLAIIVATVWVQRNAARLIARFGTVGDDGRPRFPGGVPLLLAPTLVALLMLGDGMQRDREERLQREWQYRQWRIRNHREAARRRDALRPPAGQPEDPPPTAPRA